MMPLVNETPVGALLLVNAGNGLLKNPTFRYRFEFEAAITWFSLAEHISKRPTKGREAGKPAVAVLTLEPAFRVRRRARPCEVYAQRVVGFCREMALSMPSPPPPLPQPQFLAFMKTCVPLSCAPANISPVKGPKSSAGKKLLPGKT